MKYLVFVFAAIVSGCGGNGEEASKIFERVREECKGEVITTLTYAPSLFSKGSMSVSCKENQNGETK